VFLPWAVKLKIGGFSHYRGAAGVGAAAAGSGEVEPERKSAFSARLLDYHSYHNYFKADGFYKTGEEHGYSIFYCFLWYEVRQSLRDYPRSFDL
jgi:hypothetical protein